MLLHEWNMKEALEVRYEEGVATGVEKGVAIGEAKVTKIFDLLEKGMSLTEIKKSIRGT
jgi:hypothetical protein